MIFKTVDSDKSLSGKAIYSNFSIKRFASATTNKDSYSFNSDFSNALKQDTDCMYQYIKAVNMGADATDALDKYMANASITAQNFVKNSPNFNVSALNTYRKEQKQLEVTTFAQSKSLKDVSSLINEYNTGLNNSRQICDNTKLSQQELASSIGDGNRILGRYLTNLNGAEASMGGYMTSLVGAKVATLGLKVATIALNAALTMGISFVISSIISGISEMIHAEEKDREKKIELGEQAVETSKKLFELSTKYIEVSKAVKSGTASNEDFVKAQDDVIEALKNTGIGVDELISKYGDLETGIKKVTLEQLKEANTEILSGVQAAKQKAQSDLDNPGGSWIINDQSTEEKLNGILRARNLKDSEKEEYNKIMEYLYKNGFARENDNYGYEYSRDGQVKYYFNDLYEDDWALSYDQLMSNYEYLKKVTTLVANQFGTNNEIYGQLSTSLNTYKESLEPVIEKVSEANQGIARELIYEQQLNGEIPKSLDDYVKIRNDLIKKLSEDNRFDHDGKESAESLIDSELADNSAFSEYAKQYVKIEQDAASLRKKRNELIDKFSKSFKDTEWFNTQDENTIEIAYKLSSKQKYENLSALKKDVREFVASGKSLIDDTEKISFDKLISSTGDGTFMDSVDKYIDKITALKDALSKRDSGDFTESDLVELIKQFPELANQTDNLDEAIDGLITDMNKNMSDSFYDKLQYMSSDSDIAKLKGYANAVLELGKAVDETSSVIDLDTVSDGIDKLNSAIKESVSSTGMSEQAIKDLTERYSGLKDFDAATLFEKTSNGIHANTTELRKLEAEYQKLQKSKIDSELDQEITLYNELTKRIDASTSASERAALYKERERVLDRIEDTSQLASMYEGLTSAFKKWSDAQSIGEEGDNYDSLVSGLENIKKLYEDGLVGTNKFRAAVQLMSNQDLSNASISELISVYDTNYNKIERYFQEGSDGCLNFLKDVQAINKQWVHMNQDGSWQIDFGIGGDEDVAKALGINVETVQSILRKLSDFGFDIKLDSVYTNLELLKTNAEKANEALIKMGKTDYKFNFTSSDIKDLNTQITKAKDIFNSFKKNKDGTIDLKVEGAKEASDVLTTLILTKQDVEQPIVMKVDLSQVDDEKLKKDLEQIQKIVSKHEYIELKVALGENTDDLQKELDDLIQEAGKSDNQILVGLKVDENTSYDEINTQINDWSKNHSEMLVKIGTKDSEIQKESDKIKRAIQSALDGVRFDLKFSNDALNKLYGTTVTIKVNADITEATSKFNVLNSMLSKYTTNATTLLGNSGSTSLAKTASQLGLKLTNKTLTTSGFGFANGGRINSNGVGLVGELGTEILVRDGKYYTIGESGATMIKYQKGDIIFDAEQTRQLLSNGKITSGKNRGFAFSSGSGTLRENGKVKTTTTGTKSTDSKDKSTDSTKSEDYQTIDWIETAISRIERVINRLKNTASNAFKSLSTRLTATSQQISNIKSELTTQTKAYDRYIKQANSVKLSSDLKKKVQNGTIDITKYKGETAELIEEYQKWYEKALECSDAIQTLHQTLAELYRDNFENTQTDYKNQLSLLDTQADKYNNVIDKLEIKGYLKSTEYYAKLQKVESQRILLLKKEYNDLQSQLSKAMASGEISKYSEEWYSMNSAINEVSKSIDEANNNLLKYDKTIRELKWEYFDYMQDRISQITKESDFLISILDNANLFTDNGQFNEKGTAVVGLHTQSYNVYMAQADKYAQELQKINKDIATDPYNTELIKRREELLKLQQDSIKAAENEKQSIVDLVKKGINLELDSLKKLISTYKESLDQTKDAYDYQKKIEQKTKNIASLQKQLSAYQNDTSEESRTKIQKLQVDLEKAQTDLQETEYDKYISDSKKLLDDLYDEYETTLNQRLDNVDALIGDMIDMVNEKSTIINETLQQLSTDLGYTMSDAFNSIWGESGTGAKIVTTYGTDFSAKLTTTNTTLSSIEAKVTSMVGVSNNGGVAPKTTTQNTTTTNSTSTSTPKSTSTSQTTSSSTTTKTSTPTLTQAIKEKVAAAIWNGKLGWGAGKDRINRLNEVFGANNGIQALVSNKVGMYYKGNDLSQYSYANMRKKFKGYKTGGYVDYTGIAQVHGTPSSPELFLNSTDSKNFTSLRDALRDMSKKNVSLMSNHYGIPKVAYTGINDVSNMLSGITEQNDISNTNNINITIPIDHVDDYNDFVRQLKSDGKFEKFIQSVTIDRLNGKGSLEKNRYS